MDSSAPTPEPNAPSPPGRAPDVYVFNPFTEARIAQGRSFTPVDDQKKLASDLETLPQFLSRAGDIVLVSRLPDPGFPAYLAQIGFSIPEFVELPQGVIPENHPLRRRRLGNLRPWGWGPESLELLAPLAANATGTAGRRFAMPQMLELYSKGWSANLLRRMLSHWREPWLCDELTAGREVTGYDQALNTIASIRRCGHHKLIVKESYGSAGHNSIRLWEPEMLEVQHRWLRNAFANGRKLVIEPWLERVADFSVQLEMGDDGLRVCGNTGLLNDLKGQFLANWAEADNSSRLPSTVRAALAGHVGVEVGIERFYKDLIGVLQTELRRVGYIGPLGIDALVYQSETGERRVKPVIEINPRHTMGRVTLELMRYIAPGAHGCFRLVSFAHLRRAGFKNFGEFAAWLREHHPVSLESGSDRRIRQGCVFLNPPETVQICQALFHVSRSVPELMDLLPKPRKNKFPGV